MIPYSAHKIEELIAAHLSGEEVDVPPEQQPEFERALGANEALRMFLAATAAAPSAAEIERVPPVLSQNYEIKQELGRGGMGVVYLAHQKSLGRDVALKVLRPGEQAAEMLLSRFRAEAQHLASLRHPNIVSIHEVREAGNEPYFTMDYIEGETLSAVIARGPMSPSQAVNILEQVAEAVKHAHEQGIIHRDLKPGNVLLDHSGHVYVTDFGLARSISGDSQLTRTGELLGTPQYMAPEQARGKNELIGEGTDIYALGLLLFEMLTESPAFSAASPADLIVKVLHEEAPALRKIDKRIPRDLETICQKMLQKAPAARYSNVSALLEDLVRYKAGEPLMARRPNPLVMMVRRLARVWKPAAAIAVTALVVFAVSRAFVEKPYEELMAWGDEELAQGNAEMAASVYSRAFAKSDESQRSEVVERMLHTMNRLEDPDKAIELASNILKVSPYRSFGKYDYLIAMSLLAEARANSPDGAISIWSDHDAEDINYLATRLRMGLSNFHGNAQQKKEAEQTLSALEIILAQRESPRYSPPPDFAALPAATDQQLEEIINDERSPLWNRGKDALVLARSYRDKGERENARQTFIRAYEFFRQVYPTYSGMVEARRSAKTSTPSDSPACELLQKLISEIREFDSGLLEEPEGAIEFAVQGQKWSSDSYVWLNLEICATDVKNPNAGLPYNLPRLVPLRVGETSRIGILDGTYRMTIRGRHSSFTPNDADLTHLLEVDVDGWPETIEVVGSTIALPPITVRLAEKIHFVGPPHGERLDLNQSEFRWSEVNGADHYQVQLSYTKEEPSPAEHYVESIVAKKPSLDLSLLRDRERKRVAENLIAGRTGGWRVTAVDSAGKTIGNTVETRRFLVLKGLKTAD